MLAGDLGRWELSGRLDSLGNGPFMLDGRLAEGSWLNASGQLLLPGPERLAGLLPAGARLTGLGDPRLGWSLDWRQNPRGARWQATQLATDYGMAALQANLSRTLHLDMLRWDSTGSDWQGTLLVGKYLGPRVLVYYEQSLSLQESYRLHVDYVVTRHLRLDTSVGTRGQSGVSLNWSRVW